MKDIAQQVYDKLTPRQRIIATIEAEARDDAEEVRRLVKSCPKKTYTMNDANYAEEMQMLLADSMSLECDMSHMAINYLLLEKCGKGNPESWLTGMATLQAAWDAELEERGIDPAAMAKAGCPRHPLIDWLLDSAPPPTAEAVQEVRQHMAKIQGNRPEI